MKRLTDKHPTMIKLEKITALCEELGISITFLGTTTLVRDKDQPGEFDMDYGNRDDIVQEFPPTTEYRLTY